MRETIDNNERDKERLKERNGLFQTNGWTDVNVRLQDCCTKLMVTWGTVWF